MFNYHHLNFRVINIKTVKEYFFLSAMMLFSFYFNLNVYLPFYPRRVIKCRITHIQDIYCLDFHFDNYSSINNTISLFIEAANSYGYKMIDHSQWHICVHKFILWDTFFDSIQLIYILCLLNSIRHSNWSLTISVNLNC